MTKLLFLISLFLSVNTIAKAQCGCEILTQNDGSLVLQCDPTPVAKDNKTEVGLSFTVSETVTVLGVTIKFNASSKEIIDNLNLRLSNNQVVTLQLLNSQQGILANSEISQAVYLLDDKQISHLEKSDINYIILKLIDGKLRTYKVSLNHDIIKKQITCANKIIENLDK